MFKKKSGKNIWIVLIVLLAIAAIILVMQTQILTIVKDLQTSIFTDFVEDVNPLPPAKDWLQGINTFQPIKELVEDSNPLPPALPFPFNILK